MSRLISYSQNFEDILLWRALSDVEDGFYIDIGAQSPDIDSVSRLFYEQGWRGVHVDAMASYAEQLRKARPEETVIHAAVTSEGGVASFFQMPDTGLSTVKTDIAESHAKSGYAVEPTIVAAITLDDLLSEVGERAVHWLKIDVEGAEGDVLAGWRTSPVRPWVVVVESTLPMSQVQSHEGWEPGLLAKGYVYAYFDGLNRYYVSSEEQARLERFNGGPNVFDGIAFSGTSSSSYFSLIKENQSRCEAIAADAGEHAERLRGMSEELDAKLRAAHEQLKSLHEQMEHESAIHQRELMSKVEEGHANLRSMREQYDTLKGRFDMHVASEEYWKAAAKALEQHLTLVRSSVSWRITAPLRYGARLFRFFFSVPKRVLRWSMRVARFIVVCVMRQVLRRPEWREAVVQRLDRYPGIKGRLRALSVNSGLVAPVPVDRWSAGGVFEQQRAGRLSRSGAQVLMQIEHALGKVVS